MATKCHSGRFMKSLSLRLEEGKKVPEGRRTAIIIGAGPAGLTAAYELLDKTDIKPIIFEMDDCVGGISRTTDYRGNRIDIGGHRFFSKSDRVMEWWTNILPLQRAPARDSEINGTDFELPDHAWHRGIGASQRESIPSPDPEVADDVMLIRRRLSRILFGGKFFPYPVSLDMGTLSKLGAARTAKIAASYIKARLFPIKEEESLEEFLINRFGKELYRIFFKDYTEKVWGVPCSRISPEWGAQRTKGLSVFRAVHHALRKRYIKDKTIEQKNTETSLIERFLYPKYGPGQLWESVARIIRENGGEIHLRSKVVSMDHEPGGIKGVTVQKETAGGLVDCTGDYFFSSMPVKDLIAALGAGVPEEVAAVSRGLMYREFITVGLLLRGLHFGENGEDGVPDNWIYIQEKDLKLCRIQIFNNWSPYLVADKNTSWIGLEYICGEQDDLWEKSDEEMKRFAVAEMSRISSLREKDVLDSVVIKMPKVYPAYFGTYDRFHEVREFTDSFENLFLIGRNGMHRYNNQDHSMLSAMAAVENIINGVKTKDNIWSINIEEEYHESKS